jgi:glycosyltransferase involved in cell wall biosynthesis
VFPSLNEGFGLPLAESLAAGTPAVTSDFGSMREIAEGGGALMVDPHDDHAIADAMRTLLTDDAVHARLTAEAQARAAHPRTWDDYAAEVWDALTKG